MNNEQKRPYYDPKMAAEQKALRLALEVLTFLPKGALNFGKAIVVRPSDATMKKLKR